MRKEEFFEVLGDIDDDIVKGAMKPMKKKINWKVWGTMAACICLVVMGALVVPNMKIGAPAGEDIPGNIDAGGADTGPYSVAVFPDTESAENVAAADVTSLAESEMMQLPLAEYLPKELPAGFHYGRGSHYETVMKDGMRYNMLRVEYITGEIPEQQFAEDGGAIAPPPGAEGDHFLVMVLDHQPKGNRTIYKPEDITASLLQNGRIVYVQRGDAYIGLGAESTEVETVLGVMRNWME